MNERKIAEEVVKLIPQAPSGLSPIEWVAVFLAIMVVVVLMLLVFRVPAAIERSADRSAATVTNAITLLTTEMRTERQALDVRAETIVGGLHQKLDRIALSAAQDRGQIRRDIARLNCAPRGRDANADVSPSGG